MKLTETMNQWFLKAFFHSF